MFAKFCEVDFVDVEEKGMTVKKKEAGEGNAYVAIDIATMNFACDAPFDFL